MYNKRSYRRQKDRKPTRNRLVDEMRTFESSICKVA